MKTVVCTLQCSDLYIASEASRTTNYCLLMFVCQGPHLALSSLDFQAYTMTTIIIMFLQLCVTSLRKLELTVNKICDRDRVMFNMQGAQTKWSGAAMNTIINVQTQEQTQTVLFVDQDWSKRSLVSTSPKVIFVSGFYILARQQSPISIDQLCQKLDRRGR